MATEKAVKKAPFEILNAINVNEHTETKNGLTYLSWAWAWSQLKMLYPDAQYIIYERDSDYGPINYFTDGRTCWVKTSIVVEGLEHIEMLPVMDFRNNSIPLEKITSTDVNRAIQRSLTKAVARHGLGLYIYAGEDLPGDASEKVRPLPTATHPVANAVSTDMAATIQKIDTLARQMTTGMTPEQKAAFAKEKIIPFIGAANYKMCKDKSKLEALLESLESSSKSA